MGLGTGEEDAGLKVVGGVVASSGTSPPTLLPCRPLWPGFLANTVIYATVIGVCWFGFANLRRPRPGHCVSCGYDLSGLAEGATCPECGTVRLKVERAEGDYDSGMNTAASAAAPVAPLTTIPTGILLILLGLAAPWSMFLIGVAGLLLLTPLGAALMLAGCRILAERRVVPLTRVIGILLWLGSFGLACLFGLPRVLP